MAGGATKASLGSDQVWSAKGGIREADLAKIWAGQSFAPLALRLSDGRSPRVILRGRPGGGAGPDFRDAVIAFDGEERRGDVELHLHASSFRVHGHDKDPAYNRVVLHVVVWADDEADTRLSNGAWAPVAGFESWLAMRSEEMSDWLENATIWREPCTRAAQGLGEEGIDAVLSAEGEARFALKKDACLIRSPGSARRPPSGKRFWMDLVMAGTVLRGGGWAWFCQPTVAKFGRRGCG